MDFVNTEDALAQLLTHIVTRYLSKLYAICVIWDVSTPSIFNHTLDIMLKLASTHNDPTSSVAHAPPIFHTIMTSLAYPLADSKNGTDSSLASAIETAVNFGCQAFVVPSDMALAVLVGYTAIIDSCLHRYPNNHFVFVCKYICGQEFCPTSGDILLHPLMENVLIITENQTGSYDLITPRFVGPDRVDASDPIWLDTFHPLTPSAHFDRDADLFPDKWRNLMGRPLRMAMFNYAPYTVWKEVPPGHGNANKAGEIDKQTMQIDGTESVLMQEFCAQHNCTLDIELEEEGQWGEIWENRSGIGILGAVAERRVDMGISALYGWYHEYEYLDFTTPITRTGVTCVVPKPQLLSGLYLPAMPFSWPMWLGVFLSMVIGALALIFVQYCLYRRRIGLGMIVTKADRMQPAEITFQICTMYLFQASNMMSKPGVERYIITCVLLTGLMIGNAYSGGLASIMTVPQYEDPIDTPHQMADQNLAWGGTQDAWLFSIQLAKQPDIIKLRSLFQTKTADELRHRTQSGTFGFGIERLPYGSFAIGDYIDVEAMDYLQLMRNDIYYEYTLAMTSKASSLKAKLDTMIGRIVQSGISSLWEWQAVVKYSDNKVQLRIATSRGSHASAGPQDLSVSRVLGAFIIWLIGMAVACACFAVEWGLHKAGGGGCGSAMDKRCV